MSVLHVHGPPAAHAASRAARRWRFDPWLAGIVLAAAALRAPGWSQPLRGPFVTKNAIYGMAARNWAEGRADWWWPTLDLLAPDGRQSWYLLEYAWPAAGAALAARATGVAPELWGRVGTTLATLLAVVFVHSAVARVEGQLAARAAAAAVAFSPLGIFLGQSLVFEPWALLAVAVVWRATLGWSVAPVRSVRGCGWLALIVSGGALGMLLKPFLAAFALPLAAIVWQAPAPHNRARCGRAAAFLAAATLCCLPALVWYASVWQVSAPGHPDRSRIYYSVRQSLDAQSGSQRLLFTPEFYVRTARNLAGPLLTPIGALLLVRGLAQRRAWRHAAWGAAVAVLVVALPRKFHELNYYFLWLLPPAALFVGIGWQALVEGLRRRYGGGPTAGWLAGRGGAWAGALLLAGWGALGLGLAYRNTYATAAEDRGVQAAAVAARRATPPDRPLVTLHGSTLDLLYYADRRGWALDAGAEDLAARLEACRRGGATHLAWAYDPAARPARVLRLVAPLEICAAGEGFALYRWPEPAQEGADLRPSQAVTRPVGPSGGIASEPRPADRQTRPGPTTSGMPTTPGTM